MKLTNNITAECMDITKKTKKYRKNEWRKVWNFLGDEILYEWRPAKGGYVQIREKYVSALVS